MTEDAILYLHYLLAICLHLFIYKYDLYTESAELDQLEKVAVQGEVTLPIICSLPASFSIVPGIAHPRLAATRVIGIREHGLHLLHGSHQPLPPGCQLSILRCHSPTIELARRGGGSKRSMSDPNEGRREGIYLEANHRALSLWCIIRKSKSKQMSCTEPWKPIPAFWHWMHYTHYIHHWAWCSIR